MQKSLQNIRQFEECHLYDFKHQTIVCIKGNSSIRIGMYFFFLLKSLTGMDDAQILPFI